MCTRNAPDPQAGSSTVSFSTAARSPMSRSSRADAATRWTRERREERAGAASLARYHEGLEGAAEHLGVDGRFGPPGTFLGDGEPILREQVVDQRAVCVVREGEAARMPLDRRAREES